MEKETIAFHKPNYSVVSSGKIRKGLMDPTIISLLIANLIVLVLAISKGWSLYQMVWIYWLQSIIIGFFMVLKILSLKEFSTAGLSSNGRAVPETREGKISTAKGFVIAYGIMHIFFAIMLSSGYKGAAIGNVNLAASFQGLDWSYILLVGAIFFINHLFSFLYYKLRPPKKDNQRKPNIGTMMFAPFVRYTPILLLALFANLAFAGIEWVFFFILIKTGADIVLHIAEHNNPWF